MNPKQFLLAGGAVLLLVGILGAAGVIGPTADESIFGATWFFDYWENVVHTILGIVALIAAFVLPHKLQKPLVVIVGVVALLFGLYSAFVSSDFMGYAMLQQHADTVLHLGVAVWAFWASMRKPSMMM